MHVLAEHLSCVVNETEFDEAIKTYSDVYIVTKIGTIYRHTKMKGNRFVRMQVNEIPGLKAEDVKVDVQEEISFLPNGKLPGHFLDELVQFFKEVMEIKKADQEAMAHVLYNEKDRDGQNKGYRISIPNQIVGKASVTYQTDHIHQGDIIVLDIHSHNTMGAFFSGTDDTDDRIGINYAGVVGKLDSSHPEFKWRFNFNKVKRNDVEIYDIFDLPKKEVKIPSEWLDRVKTQVWTHHQGGHPMGKMQPTRAGGWGGTPENTSVGGRKIAGGSIVVVPDWVRFPPGFEDIRDDMLPEEEYQAYLRAMNSDAPRKSAQQQELQLTDEDKEGPSRRPLVIVDQRTLTQEEIKDYNKRGVDVEIVDSMPLGGGEPKSSMSNSEEYHLNACEYGKEAADAYEQIDTWIGGLEGQDDLLLQLIQQAYSLLSRAGQEKLDTHGL